MNVLLYATEQTSDGRRLRMIMSKIFPGKNLEMPQTIEEFKAILHRPLREEAVAVLMASDKEELKGFLPLKELMRSLAVVLLIPDYDQKTVELAHLLLPRYLDLKGNAFGNLIQVLAKLGV